jgi:hypothetical protein
VVADVEGVRQPDAVLGLLGRHAELSEDPAQRLHPTGGDPCVDRRDKRVVTFGAQHQLGGVDGRLVHRAQQGPQSLDRVVDRLQRGQIVYGAPLLP